MKSVKLLSAIAALFVSASPLWSQTAIATWSFAGLTDGGVSPMAANSSDPNVTVSGLTRGSGVTSPTGLAGNAWGGAGFYDGLSAGSQSAATATTAGNYITFAVAPNTGFAESFSSISAYNIRRSSSGPSNMLWQYSLDGTTFTDIGTTVAAGANTTSAGNDKTAVTLSSITALQNVEAGTTVTFRLVLWNATGDGGTWYFNGGGSNVSNRSLTINGTVAPSVGLPVELVSFTGKQENHANVLNWATASEKDITSYELERSADGRAFSKIASFAPKGNNVNTQNDYAFTDKEAGTIAYYRLKIAERNDKANYSNVVVLRNDGFAGNVTLYPNPAEDHLSVEGLTGNYSYQVTDILGNIVISATVNASEEGRASVNVAQLPAGHYFIRLNKDNSTQTLRFVKK